MGLLGLPLGAAMSSFDHAPSRRLARGLLVKDELSLGIRTGEIFA
jgi:hypothetical protein